MFRVLRRNYRLRWGKLLSWKRSWERWRRSWRKRMLLLPSWRRNYRLKIRKWVLRKSLFSSYTKKSWTSKNKRCKSRHRKNSSNKTAAATTNPANNNSNSPHTANNSNPSKNKSSSTKTNSYKKTNSSTNSNNNLSTPSTPISISLRLGSSKKGLRSWVNWRLPRIGSWRLRHCHRMIQWSFWLRRLKKCPKVVIWLRYSPRIRSLGMDCIGLIRLLIGISRAFIDHFYDFFFCINY